MGILLDQGYFINSQPILYQDNTDSSKYKVEVNKVLINEPSNQIINSNSNFSQTLNLVDTSANRIIVSKMLVRIQILFYLLVLKLFQAIKASVED